MVPAIVSATFLIVARAPEESISRRGDERKKHLEKPIESRTSSNHHSKSKHSHHQPVQHRNNFEKHLKDHLRNDYPHSRCQYSHRKKDGEEQSLLSKK
ncbi:uncharacterized protein FA14DRAFT_4896 [Meira miltonrushii]|uniref:Uncharacterized protein n=1 Tax=Meira miltonrushii TaxID=1280837 RepID=A0A316VHA0_9BASI|nr:uncharacterized protein FA14DRAFT_4896 [Meira miltonrushii]PWN36624.1 hypothetical protein FA14DRAFT_4896 [Meira miltonrushii]